MCNVKVNNCVSCMATGNSTSSMEDAIGGLTAVNTSPSRWMQQGFPDHDYMVHVPDDGNLNLL
jgi:hypothetical protein